MIRLIRPINLLFIALTQLLFQYCVIEPLFNALGYPTTLSGLHFALLVISTACIAGAGYVINDYFDVAIDEINRPNKVIVGRSVAHQSAFNLYLFLNAVGIILGFFCAWKAGNWAMGCIHFAIAGLLWFYANGYKRILLVGNIVVALLTASVVLLPIAFEPLIYKGFPIFGEEERFFGKLILQYGLGLAVFAFLLNLMREITKDVQDREGDLSNYCNSVPIAFGIGGAKLLLAALCLLVMALVFSFQKQQNALAMDSTVWYFALLVQLPLLAYLISLFRGKEEKDFALPSAILKLVMLTGVCYLILFKSTIRVEQPADTNGITIEEQTDDTTQ